LGNKSRVMGDYHARFEEGLGGKFPPGLLYPLSCPECGGRMKVVAFIHDLREIKRISENLGEGSWRAPPPFLKGAADDPVLAYDLF